MAYRRRKFKSVRRRSRSTKRTRVSRRLPAYKKLVKRLIRRSVETKHNQGVSVPLNIDQPITGSDAINLLPYVQQGTGEANRVGTRINPVSLTIKLALNCLDAKGIASFPSPTYFDIYIFKLKSGTGTPPTDAIMFQFLQDDNTDTSYVGAITDGLRPVNDNLFTLKFKKRVCLSNQTNATNSVASQAAINPNRTLYWNLTKCLKKQWIYDDDASLPINDNLWIAIGSTQTDGASFGTNNIGRYSIVTSFKYKDA